jgi:hypothetical protein
MALRGKTIFLILFSFLMFFGGGSVMAQKIDTIVHINGNVLTGDFKKMAYGVITYKMDGMGTISVEEVKVNTMRSIKQFEVKMKDGSILYGSMDTSSIDRKVNIIMENGRKSIFIEEIVEIYPIRRSFWMRTSGNLSLGVNYSKGSNVATLAFSGNLSYRKKKSYFEYTWDNNNTFQQDSLTSSNISTVLGWQLLLKNKWSSMVSVGASQNSELGTKLRLALNMIGIRDISYNIWNRLFAGGGLTVVRETPYDNSGVTEDLAGLVHVAWKVYKYTAPKVWVDANVSFIPYLTDPGRYRVVINLNPKVSVFSNNFKIGFASYYNFDNQPPSDATTTNDWGINLQITYTFH